MSPFWFTALPSSGSTCDTLCGRFLRSYCECGTDKVPPHPPAWEQPPDDEGWERMDEYPIPHPTDQSTHTLEPQEDGVPVSQCCNLLRKAFPFLLSFPDSHTGASWGHFPVGHFHPNPGLMVCSWTIQTNTGAYLKTRTHHFCHNPCALLYSFLY